MILELNKDKWYNIQPIKLTPEIMEKVEGWNVVKDSTYWLTYFNPQAFRINMWLKDEPSSAGFEKKGYWYYGENYFEFQYLHQLQQLIRLFCNKEIEFKWEK